MFMYIYIYEGIMNEFPLFTTSVPTPFSIHMYGTQLCIYKEYVYVVGKV